MKWYMPTPEPPALLQLIRYAVDLISEFVGAKTFADYGQDTMLRSAVERQFINIGESVNLLSRADSELASRITDYRRIIDFRNVLTHSFFNVRNETVWDNATNHLPILRAEVTELIREYEED